MNTTERGLIMQRWNVIQHDLLPELRDQVGTLTPKLEKVVHTLEWVRIEEFTAASGCGIGRPPHELAWLANAFVAQSVLGLLSPVRETTTTALIERLMIDKALRRIGGFPLCKKLPSEATLSRAFEAFAEGCLAERVHEALIKEHIGDQLIGHLSRDGTAIEARERPVQTHTPAATKPATRKRGRPRTGESRAPAKESPISRQRQQTLAEMLDHVPTACDRGTKCNAQGYKVSWNGYWWQPLV